MDKYVSLILLLLLMNSCTPSENPASNTEEISQDLPEKIVIYQVFTRLFGNTNTTNKPWGTLEENGVGKFDDFTDKALEEIHDLGVTHIWYTGVPHHAVITDYTEYGISQDDPDVVKGRAGSPYAVKDYYNVNPDLANDPSRRLDEFRDLVARTHAHDMKVIIDIVPNHVARRYEGISRPDSVEDFGAGDDVTVAYRRDNNFYYIPGESFKVPFPENNYEPLGGDPHPLSDGEFEENPAKWTGNGAREARPGFYDWYETVKINYGVKPDGTRDFPELPDGFQDEPESVHYEFWKEKDVPDSWKKFRDIALYWLEMDVDGFRFDMAEMVPVEFWSYMNSAIKMKNPDALLLAEVYNPALYRDYIHLGKMDYLYDKVELYDTLRHIIQGHGSTDNIAPIQEGLADIEHHMLHFLENHDEQRIASPEFAGNPDKARPAMVLSATISTSPTMIYFGQEVGEPGKEDAGFGDPSRTSIFDYVGVPHHQRWMNNGAFDGGQLTENEKELRSFYKRLLNLTIHSEALRGDYRELHSLNRNETSGYDDRLFSFARWSPNEKMVVITNFSPDSTYNFRLRLPEELLGEWEFEDGSYELNDALHPEVSVTLMVSDGQGFMEVSLPPLHARIFRYP